MSEALVAAILGVVAALFLCVFWLAPGGVLALWRRVGELQPDVRLGYSVQTLYRVLDAYGRDGRRSFGTLLLADMIFPAIYGGLLYSLGDLLAREPMSAIAQHAAIAGAAFDYAENVFLLLVLNRFPSRFSVIARLASISTSLKMAAIAVSVGSLSL
jgi:hypothetical protein